MTNQSLLIALLAAGIGCSGTQREEPGAGTGGSVGVGGNATGAGGADGSGGALGTGGASTGGGGATGGVVGTGGSGSGGVVATGGAATGGGGGTLYLFDLTGFGTTEAPGLQIANETLAFPLALGSTEQSLSLTNPGDLIVAYTRVGCSIDPEEWIGMDGVAPIPLPAAEPVALTHLTIDQFVGLSVTATAQSLAEGTCLTLKAQGGPWLPFLQPETITLLSDDSVRAEFVIDGTIAEGAALFLPTYTYVSSISYRVVTPAVATPAPGG